jgi:pimeloyl-ACP methyl ester carboxylesterase
MDRFAMAALTRSRADLVVSPQQIAAIQVPTLGIVGSLDDAKASMERLKTLRPDMKLVFVEGATHTGELGILAWPETVAEIRAFLASHRQQTN